MIQRLKKRNFLFKAALVAAVLYGASAPSLFAASAQVGFSPEGTAQQLVINVIGSAKDNIRMMAYSFTAPDIMKALIAAKRRGVDVKIVVDELAGQYLKHWQSRWNQGRDFTPSY